MRTRRILLVTEPRLLRDMVKRVIEKTPGLELVGEVSDFRRMDAAIEETEADWVILFLAPDQSVPEEVEDLLSAYPFVRFLAMASDGSQVKMNWVEYHAQAIDRLNLDDLISLLSNDFSNAGSIKERQSRLGIGVLGDGHSMIDTRR